jgi:hypothetical protein
MRSCALPASYYCLGPGGAGGGRSARGQSFLRKRGPNVRGSDRQRPRLHRVIESKAWNIAPVPAAADVAGGWFFRELRSCSHPLVCTRALAICESQDIALGGRLVHVPDSLLGHRHCPGRPAQDG